AFDRTPARLNVQVSCRSRVRGRCARKNENRKHSRGYKRNVLHSELLRASLCWGTSSYHRTEPAARERPSEAFGLSLRTCLVTPPHARRESAPEAKSVLDFSKETLTVSGKDPSGAVLAGWSVGRCRHEHARGSRGHGALFVRRFHFDEGDE